MLTENLFITHALSKRMELIILFYVNVNTMEHLFAELLVQTSYVGLE